MNWIIGDLFVVFYYLFSSFTRISGGFLVLLASPKSEDN